MLFLSLLQKQKNLKKEQYVIFNSLSTLIHADYYIKCKWKKKTIGTAENV
jgi:hypothetical protein